MYLLHIDSLYKGLNVARVETGSSSKVVMIRIMQLNITEYHNSHCRRAAPDPIYKTSNIDILPGYPEQTGSDLQVAFYVMNPSGSNSSLLPVDVLLKIISDGRANISAAIGRDVIKIERLVSEGIACISHNNYIHYKNSLGHAIS